VQALARRAGVPLLFVAAIQGCWAEPIALGQAAAKAPLPIAIPMELLFSRPLVRGTVNAEAPVSMLIDPHLSTTLIAPGLADRLRIRPTRNDSGAPQAFVEFAFGAYKNPKVPVEVRDIGQYVSELGPASQPAVVLALSMWGDQLVTFDYGRFQMRVEPGALPDPNARDVYALVAPLNELRLSLAVGTGIVEGRIDPLFPGNILLPDSYLTELPLASKPMTAGPVRIRDRWLNVSEARLAETVTFAGAEMKAPLVAFGNIDRATIRYGALARLSITYDLTRGRAQLNVR
jgi:hypothetical protein